MNYCMTTYPCMHFASIDDGPIERMYARQFIKILSERNAPIPGHFAYLLPPMSYIQERIDEINRKLTYHGPYPQLHRKYGEMHDLL